MNKYKYFNLLSIYYLEIGWNWSFLQAAAQQNNNMNTLDVCQPILFSNF